MDIIWTILSSLHFESTTFFCQVALFFVLHYSLQFLVYTPIMQIRDLRDKRIATNLAAAEASAAAARALKEQYEERVRQARSEGHAALGAVTLAAETARKSRVDKAREEASRILEQARAEAEAAREKAEKTVGAQSEEVAKAIASRLVSAALEASDAQPVLAKIGGK